MNGLAADFAPASKDEWLSLVARNAERDAPALASTSEDGVAIGPIYGPADSAALPFQRQGPWRVVQRIDRPEVENAMSDIQADRRGGVSTFDLVFATSPVAFGVGLPVPSAPALARVLSDGEAIAFRIDAGEQTEEILRLYPCGRALFDPIATLAAQGFLERAVENHLGSRKTLFADGRVWHSGGATVVQELAAVIATLAAYFNAGASERVGVALAADADQFMTIAKFRAMRLLSARFQEVADMQPARLELHAETSWRMMSRIDQHTNILRTTMAVFAAGVAGADSITALPFDTANRVRDPFARRIARNSQSILLDESGLGHVEDPGAGAGAVEDLTRELARAAWERFRAIEAEGGMIASLRSGSLQHEIAAARDRRLAAIRDNKVKLTGVNAYPDKAAMPLAPFPGLAIPQPATPPAETVEALRFVRLSEPFEESRT